MRARIARFVTGVMVATLIIALATMGGYRLASSGNSGHSHARLATGVGSTYISNTGSDTNNVSPHFCQRITPCQTFSIAYGITVPGGEVYVLDPGTFGDLTISQTLTFDGGPGRGLILSGSDGIDVYAGANDVVILRHLQIKGAAGVGFVGINFVSGKELILDDVTIEGFIQGIVVQGPGPASVTITNSRIQNNSGTGIAITPASGMVQVTISHSQIARNYFGLVAQDGADVSLTDSTVTGSTSIGVGCQTFGNGSCTIQTENDRFDHNWAAVWMNHGAGNAQITESLSNDAVFGNTYGIYGDFGGTLNAVTFGNNRFLNNFQDGVASSTMTQK